MSSLSFTEQLIVNTFTNKNTTVQELMNECEGRFPDRKPQMREAYWSLTTRGLLNTDPEGVVTLKKTVEDFFIPCPACSFEVFNPVMILPNSDLGLYNDIRFPGRCILSFRKHEEHLEDMNSADVVLFMEDVKTSINAIKEATGVFRVNFAVLGNTENHVHAHLIPRYPENEKHPGKSPWNDIREHAELDAERKQVLIQRIRNSSAFSG